MNTSLCLNADLGELTGAEGRALDAAMLEIVTRCNIACGGHAGDAETMRQTIRTAKEHGVQIGAHPSYPDIENFGRRSLAIDPAELAASLDAQTQLLLDIAEEEGARVVHLKPHGALYNDAARDAGLAQLIAGVAARAGIGEMIGPPHSELGQAARSAGIRFLAEGFADRSYETDGALTPRNIPGAVLEDTDAVLAQALAFAREGRVAVRAGGHIALRVQTLCLHSDTPGAAEHAHVIQAGLRQAGIAVR
ncbi:MAG: 5-oxoprolinase subunit PxpA, partial [Hyphomonas sp.]|uniref:5-oxoprolinase subunit PxpA n=1 Tax=Hyphomonas sp. TaxID=87 RepID=UPI0034A00D48